MKLKHYLIPTEQNEYKPWIIGPTALGIFCLVIWSLRFIVPATTTLAASTIEVSYLMNKVNEERTQRFIPALVTNNKLNMAATSKANDMLARSYFAHVDPDGNYVWPKVEATGYTPFLTLGENLAMDFSNADAVIDAWMNSPTHRANIVNDKFEDQGLSAILGQYEPNHQTTMIVNLFGTLYKSKSQTANAQPPPPPPVSKPAPIPAPKPTPAPVPSVKISQDVKITTTLISGRTIVNVKVSVEGNPKLVTGRLKTQSITLIPGSIAGEFVGSFTFDQQEQLGNETITIEARDKNNNKISKDYPVKIESPSVSKTPTASVIPVSNEAQTIKVLRIVFGVFASIYLIFLIVDAIIIHRAKIKRDGINPTPHIFLFLLIAGLTLFSNWF